MRSIVVLSLILLLFYAFEIKGQCTNEVPYAYLKLANGQSAINELYRDTEQLVYYEDSVFSGCCVEYRLNGKPFYKINFLQGLKDGQFIKFDENGNQEEVGIYKEGKMAGLWLSYYKGFVVGNINYHNGKKEGEYFEYSLNEYSNGTILMEKGLYKGDVKDGKWITYDMGKEKRIENYKLGVENGEFKLYNVTRSSGKIVSQIWHHENYKDGRLDGEQLYYYTNEHSGRIQRRENYLNGKLDGEQLYYYTNRNLQKKETYSNGSYNGEFIKQSEDGKLTEKSIYENNIRKKHWSITFGGSPDF